MSEWLDERDVYTIYWRCRLLKGLPNGFHEQMAYLPIQYCREGMSVRLRRTNGAWDEGWAVVQVYPWEAEDRPLPTAHANPRPGFEKTFSFSPFED